MSASASLFNFSDYSAVIDDIQAAADPQPLQKLLYSRKDAAYALSISTRSLDYLIGNKQLSFRKLGKKIMISAGELSRFARMDHSCLTATPAEREQ